MRTPRTRVSLTLAEVEAINDATYKAGAELMQSPRPDSEYLQDIRREELLALISAGVKMEKAASRLRDDNDEH